MKKYFINLFLFLFLMTFQSFAGQYRPVRLIEARWGDKPGEFGLTLEAEGNCPQSLTVDASGNLAILDPVNRRVQRYSAEGKWLAAFHINCRAFDIRVLNDRFILLAPYDYQIEQYDRDGNLIEKIDIDPGIDLLDGLRVSGDKIFVQTSEQLLYDVSERSSTKQAPAMTRGLRGQRDPGWKFQTRWLGSHQGLLIAENSRTGNRRTITINSPDELGSLIFLDTDKYGNIYLRAEIFAADGKSCFEVIKLTGEGNQLSRLRIVNENIVAPFKPITIDQEGNIYFLEIKTEGFSVIRWTEQQ